MMSVMLLLVPIALSFVGGIFLVNYLTVHPLEMSVQLLLAVTALFGVIAVLVWKFRGKQLAAALVLSLIAFAVGYSLRTNAVLAHEEDPQSLPPITRATTDPGDGHTAVIYLTHGEPPTYNPIGWLNQFREFDEQGIPFVPVFARPFFLLQLRNKYLEVGQSHHRMMHTRMLADLEKAMRQAGHEDLKFYLAFLDDDPGAEAATIQALNGGASTIVVAEVFVSISNHTAEGEEQIESVRPEDYGVEVRFTGPLWDSTTMHRMFVEKANAAIGDTDKSKVGVILVGHGQPAEWDKEFPTETEHELKFRELALNMLAADGYKPENMGLAWMSFKEPPPKAKVEELLKNGVEKIIYFAAAISADSIHSQSDIPELIHEAAIPAGMNVINLGAWNDHPLAIQAIQEMIEPLLPAAGK
jgi:protoheme ferro-lyase